MNRLLAVRIVRTEYKVLYVAVYDAINFAISFGLGALGVPGPVREIITLVLSLGMFAYGARVFRGAGEEIEPPRAWWRMTALRGTSGWLGTLFVVFSVMFAIQVGLATAPTQTLSSCGCNGVTQHQDDLVTACAQFTWAAILAFFYLNSAARLPWPVFAKQDKIKLKTRA